MSASTIYDVKVRYTLDDKAGAGAGNMARQFDRANSSAMSLRGAMAGVAAAAGGMYVAKKALIDFNSEIDQMKIGMTTIMTMQLKKPWDEAKKSSESLFKSFQEMAKKSPATTKDFMTMANALTPGITAAGGNEGHIERLTQGAVLAGLATGTRADVAALDVKQMLAGTVTERDMMANQLISAKGMTKEAFNDLSQSARGAMVETMLQDPALLKAADEFGKSFAGQVSTFQDQLQMALGTVGRPLMQELTSEFAKMNAWIEKHPRTLARISKEIGGMIKDAFSFTKSVVGFLVDNRETIMSIAKIFLVFKGAQLATGIIGGFVGGIKSVSDTLKKAAVGMNGAVNGGSGLITSMKGIGSAALSAAPHILMLGAAALEVGGRLFNWISGQDEIDAKVKSGGQTMNTIDEALGVVNDMTKRIFEIDKINPGTRNGKAALGLHNERATLIGKLNDPTVMGEVLRKLDEETAGKGGKRIRDMGEDAFAKSQVIYDSVWKMIKTGDVSALIANGKMHPSQLKHFEALKKDIDPASLKAIYRAAFPDQFPQVAGAPKDPADAWKPGTPTNPDVKVTIQKIEVASDDPDRFVFGMVKAFKSIANNPTQAASALPGSM